jgi:polar amino acid transport system permease protein
MLKPRRKLSRLDWLIFICLLAGAALVIHRMFFDLNYRWNWGIVPTYLLRYDEEQRRWLANALLDGFFTTIRLSLWGMLLALLLGILLGVMRVAPRLAPRAIGRLYVEFIRNTPALVLVFLFYYFVNDRILSHFAVEPLIRDSPPVIRRLLSLACGDLTLVSPFISGAMTIGLFQAAYIGEIVRAGIQAIPAGQWEASRSLGLPKYLVLRLVILPQAIRTMLPPLAGEFINTIKYSSIVSIISIQELTFQGMQVMASTQATIEIWITVTAMYLILCLSLSTAVHRLERRLGGHRR